MFFKYASLSSTTFPFRDTITKTNQENPNRSHRVSKSRTHLTDYYLNFQQYWIHVGTIIWKFINEEKLKTVILYTNPKGEFIISYQNRGLQIFPSQ